MTLKTQSDTRPES